MSAKECAAAPRPPITDRPRWPNCARSSYVRFQSPAAVPLAGFRACSRQMVATLRLPFAKSPDVSKMSLWGGWRNGRDLKPFFGERNGKRRYQCKGTYPNVQFTFRGFTFRPRRALSKHRQRFTGFLPAVSNDALKRMRHTVRSWRIHRRTPATLDELAQQCDTTIQGWWNYYGAFYRTAMHSLFSYIDLRLMRWARRKYKRLGQHKRRSVEWLRTMKFAQPRLFVHWRVVGVSVG